MTLNLEELETLLAAATPGPWEAMCTKPETTCNCGFVFDAECQQSIATFHHGEASNAGTALELIEPQQMKVNSALVVALRNAAPALIARIRELENPQIATVVDPDTGFTINGPEWNELPLKARLIIQELSLQNDALRAQLAAQIQSERDFLNYALL